MHVLYHKVTYYIGFPSLVTMHSLNYSNVDSGMLSYRGPARPAGSCDASMRARQLGGQPGMLSRPRAIVAR